MMSLAKIHGEGKYYLELAKDDYYLSGGEPDGIWYGSAARLLKLKGKVVGDKFKNLLRGYSPCGKTALCQNAGQHRTSGFDLTFNAPKSVSLLWAVADEKLRHDIQAAQYYAVRQAISFIEEYAAFTRRGEAGVEREKVEGLVVALFEHSTSRALDPHLHTHAVVANLAPRSDGSWGTLELRTIMLWQKAAGMAYNLSLAESIRTLGFQTEADGGSFHISCISKSICDHFSKRSKQIIDALKDRGIKNRASAAGDIASLSTRSSKGDINRSQLLATWQKELSEFGLSGSTLHLAQLQQKNTTPLMKDVLTAGSLADELTESKSVFSTQDMFVSGGLRALENEQSLCSLRAIVTQLQQSDVSVKLGKDWRHSQIFTTKSMLNAEQSLISNAKQLFAKSWCHLSSDLIDAWINRQTLRLSEEQRTAVRNVCNTQQIAILQGSAGAGKSASMRCVRDIYQSIGRKVVGASIARSAAKNLENEAGIETHTIARLLAWLDSDKPPISSGDVLIIDEAGQVGTMYLEQLMNFAKEQNFKIILVGEDKQLDAIEHGGVLRYLSSLKDIGTTRVETIRRQNNLWDRQAVADFRDGYADKALAQYRAHNQLHICTDEESAKRAMIDAWTLFRETNPSKQAMVIAQSWTDVVELNNAMRLKLQSEGSLGYENILLKGTVSERDIDVQISLGERVRFTKNDYKRNFTNGDLGTVTKVQIMDDGDIWIRVRLDSGLETQFMTSTYCNDQGRVFITQAYAQTVYSSQGLTIEGNVFVYYSQNMDRAHTYVACSRHKDAAHIFANAQEFEAEIPEKLQDAPKHIGLEKAIANSMSRNLRPKLASEYLTPEQVELALDGNERQQVDAKELENVPAACK
ncbi:MobF family relaxase [Rheinheimera soli]|uniref:MobF family relaxase n=1 Tax=Rheinheimera soli TaxID=443616 RepID=UPI001E2A8CB4|nr:MobF family relaxase [Rheinheimera soli]